MTKKNRKLFYLYKNYFILNASTLAFGYLIGTVSYTHLRAHETSLHLVCRLLLEKTQWVLIVASYRALHQSPRSGQLFFNDTATTEIYTLHIVGSVRCV